MKNLFVPLAIAVVLASLLISIQPILAQGQVTETIICGFQSVSNGAWPSALMQGRDGALYRTTFYGGSSGYGNLFRVNTDGTDFSLLHTFAGSANGDGSGPSGGLIQGKDGVIYGTTIPSTGSSSYTIFKLNTDGTGYRLLWSFPSAEAYPQASIMQGTDGALYGTISDNGSLHLGTVIKISTNGTGLTILHDFDGAEGEGQYPEGPLIQGSDGALFGTTSEGGDYADTADGYGTVFKINKNGTGYAVLHVFGYFDGGGAFPGPVTQGTDGAIYSTTMEGGLFGAFGSGQYGGTLFRIDENGLNYKTVFNFNNSNPAGGIILGKDAPFTV
jgi:uncharacterized repeat protein (TIGR03803 family)